jgi:hypothetical protein
VENYASRWKRSNFPFEWPAIAVVLNGVRKVSGALLPLMAETGQWSRQVTPSDPNSSSDEPFNALLVSWEMTVLPKPRRSGGVTVGPSRSVHVNWNSPD